MASCSCSNLESTEGRSDEDYCSHMKQAKDAEIKGMNKELVEL